MKKIEIIEVISKRLQEKTIAGDVEKIVTAAYSSVVAADVSLRLHARYFYATRVELPIVVFNGSSALEFPFRIMHIPSAASGVAGIAPLGGKSLECKPVFQNAIAAVKNLPAGGGLGAFAWYYVTPERVVFINAVSSVDNFEVFLIRNFEDYDMFEDIVVPAGFVDKMYEVCLGLLGRTKVTNPANDAVND